HAVVRAEPATRQGRSARLKPRLSAVLEPLLLGPVVADLLRKGVAPQEPARQGNTVLVEAAPRVVLLLPHVDHPQERAWAGRADLERGLYHPYPIERGAFGGRKCNRVHRRAAGLLALKDVRPIRDLRRGVVPPGTHRRERAGPGLVVRVLGFEAIVWGERFGRHCRVTLGLPAQGLYQE